MNGSLRQGAKAVAVEQLIARALSFLAVVVVVRRLGPTSYGVLATALAVLGYVTLLGEFGLTTFTTRRVSREEVAVRDGYSQALGAGLAASSAGVLAGIAAAWFVGHGQTQLVWLTAIGGLSVIVGAVAVAGQGVLAGVGRVDLRVYSRMLVSVVNSIWLLVAVLVTRNLAILVAGMLVAACVGSAFTALWVRRAIADGNARLGVVSAAGSLAAAREALPFALLGVVAALYFRVDTLIIAWLLKPSAVGLYNSAYRVLDALIFVPSAIITLVFPSMAAAYSGNRDEFGRLASRVMGVLMVAALPIAVAGVIFAPHVIALLFGPAFSGSALVLRVLMSFVPIVFANSLLVYLLYCAGREKFVLRVALVLLVANVLFNLVAIPRYGIVGAAVVTGVCELATTLVFGLEYVRRHSVSVDIRWWVAVVGATAAFGAVLLAIKASPPFSALWATAAYGACLLLFRATTVRDVRAWISEQ